MGHPLGDVRGRQPRDEPAAGLERDDLLDRRRRCHHVVVGQLHALRLARRTRRVDQGEDVVLIDFVGRCGHVEVRVGALDVPQRHRPLRGVAVDDDHVLELRQLLAGRFDHGKEGLLDDRHLRVGVGAQVDDLLRRIGRVDRERRRAEHRRGEVGEMELGPIAEHQGDGVTSADAELGQPAGQRVDPPQQLRPGQRDAVVGRADGDDVPVVGGRAPQRLGHRRGIDRASGRLRHRAALHALLRCLTREFGCTHTLSQRCAPMPAGRGINRPCGPISAGG